MAGPALGVTISGKGIKETTSDLDAFRRSANEAEKANKGLARSDADAARAAKDASKAHKESADAQKLSAQGFNRTSAAAEAASRQAKSASGQMANLTAQWNDIAVMMAAGQNPLQLAMQQGTQVNQVMQQMGGGTTALRAVGQSFMAMISPMNLATLGVIAFGAMATQALMNTGEKAKSFGDTLDDLNSIIDETKDLLSQRGDVSALAEEFGNVTQSIKDMIAARGELSMRAMNDEAKNLVKSFREMYDGNAWLNQSRAEEMAAGLELSTKATRQLAGAVTQLGSAANMSEQLAIVTAIREKFVEWAGDVGDMTPAQRDYYATLVDTEAALARVLKTTKDKAEIEDASLAALRQAQEYAGNQRAHWEAMSKSADDVIAKYRQQSEMSAAIAAHGKDSAEVEALKRAEAMRVAEAYITQNNIAGPLAEKIRQAAEQAYETAAGADQAAIALSRAEASARALAGAMAAAAGFSTNLDNQIAVVEAQINAARNKQDVALAGQMLSLQQQAVAHRDATIAAANGEMMLIRAANEQFVAQMRKIEVLTKGHATLKSTVEANNAATRSSGAASKASEKLAEKLGKEADKWKAGLSPIEKYRSEMEKLNRVKNLLTDDEYRRAVEQLSLEFADSVPQIGQAADAIGEFVANGMKDFKGLLNAFKDMIKQMVATAIANPIKLALAGSLGLGGTAAAAGGVAGAGGAMGAVGQAGGIASLLGSIGSFGGALWGGAMNSLGALVSGGIGNMMTGISAQLGATMASVSAQSVGAALGAIAGPLAAVGLVFSFFSKKTKELDRGLRVSVDGLSAFVEEFRTIETKRFWGLSKKVRTNYETAEQETQDAIGRAVAHLQSGILNAAKVLDFGADTFAGFAHTLEISTKDLSEEEALKAVQDAVMELGDAFSSMVPGLKDQILYGEGATDALNRLANSLTGVRSVVDLLGHSFKAAGLSGAVLADNLANAFGGVDAMTSAVQTYWQAIYTEEERIATVTRQATKALADLGMAMPQSRAEYRAMVDALDLTNEATHDTYAALISLAGVFDQILPGVHGLTAALADLQGNVSTGLDASIAAANAAAKANADAASNWYKASNSIRDWIAKMRGTASPLTSPMEARAFNEAQYQSLLARAISGDITAAQGITAAADRLLQSVNNTARTQTEAALAEARVLSDLGLLAGVGDIEGARHDVIRGLLEQQASIMQQTKDYLAAGNVLTEAMIDTLETQLGSLDEAIAAAELINYAYLKERLQVTVDVLADANVPEELKKLLRNAATGVEGYIDFIVRSDLTPDLKWLAMTGASEHVKTVEYLAKNNMGKDLTSIALQTVSTLQKTVNLIVGKRLDADTMRIALAGNSELSRTVTATLASSIDPEAKKLALGNVGAYSVTVSAAFGKNISPDVQRIILTQQGTYAAAITAAISQQMTPEARRILLTQQGAYIATISGILASNMDGATRSLLLNANTSAMRAVTIRAAFASSLTEDQRAALLAQSGTINRIISAAMKGTITADQRKMLDASTATITRTINGVINTGSLTAQQSALISAISGATAGKITLGGTFQFDPSSGFKVWYDSTTQGQIAKPMADLTAWMAELRKSLNALRDGIAAEGARQAKAADDARKLQNAQAAVAALAAQKSSAVGSLESAIDRVKAFDDATGGNLGYNGGAAQFGIDANGRLIYKADAVYGASSADLKKWQAQFWGAGNLQDQMVKADGAVASIDRQLEAARKAVRDLGGVPSFAGGGYTGDAPRSGGLDGMGGFGAILHPRETVIDETSSVFTELVQELIRLRKEVEDFKSQSRQVDQAMYDQIRKLANRIIKWDSDGLPPERTPA